VTYGRDAHKLDSKGSDAKSRKSCDIQLNHAIYNAIMDATNRLLDTRHRTVSLSCGSTIWSKPIGRQLPLASYTGRLFSGRIQIGKRSVLPKTVIQPRGTRF
jgi:hypothetical protein